MYALVCVQARACVCVHTKWNISTPTVEKMAKRINMIRKACDSGPSEDSSELMSKRSFSKRLKTRRMRSVFKTRICFTPGMSSGRMSSITHKKMMKASKRCHPSPQNSQPQYAVMLSTSSSMKITISTCQKLTRRRPHGFVKHLQRMHHRLARVQGVQDKEIASEQRQIDREASRPFAGAAPRPLSSPPPRSHLYITMTLDTSDFVGNWCLIEDVKVRQSC